MLGTPRARNPTEEGWFYLHYVPSIQDLHTLVVCSFSSMYDFRYGYQFQKLFSSEF